MNSLKKVILAFLFVVCISLYGCGVIDSIGEYKEVRGTVIAINSFGDDSIVIENDNKKRICIDAIKLCDETNDYKLTIVGDRVFARYSYSSMSGGNKATYFKIINNEKVTNNGKSNN